MLTGFRWLALEVLHLDRARTFYEDYLEVDTRAAEHEAGFTVGDTDVILREPSTVPRGGLHVHYAFATPPDRYAEWYDRLDADLDLTEHDFGGSKSCYFFDPGGHCVEIGQVGDEAADAALTSVFEVVLEVESLDRAESFYRNLGFDVVDRGRDRRRVRLSGPVDLELWEPHRGIADARGGVHADLGFTTPDPDEAVAAVADDVLAIEEVDTGYRVRDPDGHYLTFREMA